MIDEGDLGDTGEGQDMFGLHAPFARDSNTLVGSANLEEFEIKGG